MSETPASRPRGGLMILVAAFALAMLAGGIVFTMRQDEPPVAAPDDATLAEALATPTLDYLLINAHDHLYMAKHLPKYLDAAEKLDVERTLFVASSDFTLKGGDYSPAEGNRWNSEEILRVAKEHPEAVIPFVTIHPDDPDKVGLLQRYKEQGAAGVKLYTGHGNFYDRSLLAEEMLPVYEWCEAEAFPICWHVNLNRYLDEFSRVLLRYPKLKVILPHFGVGFWQPGGREMDAVEQLLADYPNLILDSSFGTREILVGGFERVSANRDYFREFYIRNQDRIVWGTDMVVTGNREKTEPWIESVLRACRDLHEKGVYFFWMAARGAPHAKLDTSNTYGMLRGLDLPPEVLRKLYRDNILRFLGEE